MDRFLRAVCGPDGPEALDALVPGALTDALAHATGFLTVELPAAVQWSFRVVRRPHRGRSRAAPAWRPERAGSPRAPRTWFPAAEHRMLDVNHFVMAQAPEATADLLDWFWRSVR